MEYELINPSDPYTFTSADREVGEALASFVLGHFKDRARYNAALEAIDDPNKAETFKEKWQDGRTSLNSIGGVAHSIGKKLLAATGRTEE